MSTSITRARRNDYAAICDLIEHDQLTRSVPCDDRKEVERIARSFNRWKAGRIQQDFDDGLSESPLQYIICIKDFNKFRVVFQWHGFLNKPVYLEDGTLEGTVNDLREKARNLYPTPELPDPDIQIDIDDI